MTCGIPWDTDTVIATIPNTSFATGQATINAAGTSAITIIATPAGGEQLHLRGYALAASIDGSGVSAAFAELVQVDGGTLTYEATLASQVYEQPGDEAYGVGGINVVLPVGKRIGIRVRYTAGTSSVLTASGSVYYTSEAP